MEKKPLVYVAGALNAMTTEYVKNMSRMVKTSIKLFRSGFHVITPCENIISGIVDGDFGYEEHLSNDFTILSRCDAVYLTQGWENSKGTQREIVRAGELGIPVFKVLDDIIFWRDTVWAEGFKTSVYKDDAIKLLNRLWDEYLELLRHTEQLAGTELADDTPKMKQLRQDMKDFGVRGVTV